jgi:hypothetical protein
MGRKAEVSLYRLFNVDGTYRCVRIMKSGRGWASKTEVVVRTLSTGRFTGRKIVVLRSQAARQYHSPGLSGGSARFHLSAKLATQDLARSVGRTPRIRS